MGSSKKYRVLRRAIEALEPRTLLSAGLVKNINPSTDLVGNPASITDVNGVVFFNAALELWRSDGTAAGTFQLASNDIFNPTELTSANGTLFFVSQGYLWKSDGTTPGTMLVSTSVSGPTELRAFGSSVVFRGSGAGGSELWISDGSDAGTVRLKNINPTGNSNPRGMTVSGSRVFFRADDGTSGEELWQTDGTPGGTSRVKDINPGTAASGPSFLTDVGGTLFFSATDGSGGYELWKSDGTIGGTVPVEDIRAGSGGSTPVRIQSVNGKAMFIANDGVHGFELWSSDGTPGGTTLVRDIIPGADGPEMDNLTAVGGALFFTADDGASGQELWKSDGTATGTVRVKDINPSAGVSSNPTSLTRWGNKLFFLAAGSGTGLEPWISDGSDAGTFMLKDVFPGPTQSFVSSIAPSGSKLFFNAHDGGTTALWITDGTSAGTQKVITPIGFFANSSDIANFTTVGSLAYFTANDGTHGQELWQTDGTNASTSLVIDINPGLAGTSYSGLTNVAGALLFVANSRLYKTDAGGTSTVGTLTFSGAKNFAAAGGTLYFTAAGSSGSGLWKSDGTAGGTALVKSFDINTYKPQSLVALADGTIMFVADDGTHGFELWKSDGTATGTLMVKDIITGSASSGPLLLTPLGNTVFFRASDGANGYELWKSDGTAAGTAMVKDIRAGSEGSVIQSFVTFGGAVYFQADDGVNGNELWKSDGSAAGTNVLKDIYPGAHGSSPAHLTLGSGVLFFRADDGIAGTELWKTDGTTAGTARVADLNPGAAGSGIARMVSAGANGVVFTTSSSGNQSWQSDGTAGGTFSAYDFPPEQSVTFGDSVLIWAWSGGGYELVKIDPGATSLMSGKSTATVPQSSQQFAPLLGPQQDSQPASVYDATFLGDRPNLSTVGYLPFIIDYSNFFVSGYDTETADETRARQLAQTAATAGVPLCLNLEHWANDLRFEGEPVVARSVEKLGQIIDWMHDERPDLQVGYAGLFPHAAYLPPAVGTPAYDAWHAANARLTSLAQKVDLFFPGIYAQDERVSNWLAYARGHVAEANLFGKPVYPLIFMDYEGGASTAGKKLSPEFWRTQLDVTRALTGLAVVWGGWSADAPWDIVTRDFIANPDPLPVATPTNLQATSDTPSQRIGLAWQDRAYNETGYRIERRAAGELEFTTIANLPADSTSYLDDSAAPATNYTYRVVATGATADSPASNEASASYTLMRTHWRFDETAGTTAGEATGSNRTGTLVGGASWAGGTLGGAVQFDGTSGRVVVADAPALRFGATQNFSISAWVNLNTLPNKRVAILAKSRVAGEWYSVGIDATNHWIISGPAGDIVGPLATTGWTHLAAVQDGSAGTRKLFINGVQSASGTAQAGDGTGALWIGGAEGTSEFFGGKVDDVRIYPQALSASLLSMLATPHVQLNSPGGDAAWTVRLSADGASYQFFNSIVTSAGATPAFTRPLDLVGSIHVVGGAGNDQLLIDFSTGDLPIDYGFDFDGGAGTDTLRIRGRYDFSEHDVDTHSIWHNALFVFDNTEALSLGVGLYFVNSDLDGLALSATDGAMVQINAAQHLSNIELLGASHMLVSVGATNTLVTGGVSIDPTSQLDLTDNDLLVTYTDSSPIGTWNGFTYTGVTGLIQSGRLMTSLSYLDFSTRSLGIGESSFVLGLSAGETGMWDSEVIDATTVIVKYTHIGDIDLSGHLDGDDYFWLDSHVLQTGTIFGYSVGDIDLNGELNGDDYFWIDSTILSQGEPL